MSSAPYQFAYHQQALDFLQSLPPKLRRQVVAKINALASDPTPPNSKQLQGVTDGSDPVRRIRSGDYRVLYVVRGAVIVVLDIDHRKDVYR